jgi:hypothetical protein
MRLATFGVFATLVTLICAVTSYAQTDSKELLVGKWETKEKVGDTEYKIALEFTKDTLKVSFDMLKVEGKYAWTDKDTIEVTITDKDSKEMKEKTKVVVTKDTLSLTGKDSKETKFTRVKETPK